MTTSKQLYRPSPSEPLSQTVVEAVADVTETDPVDLDERLYDCIDPDALDRLFEPVDAATADRDGMVVFTMAGCRVEIQSDRLVMVTPTHETDASAEARA